MSWSLKHFPPYVWEARRHNRYRYRRQTRKWIFVLFKAPDRLLEPPNSSPNGYRAPFPGDKAAGTWSWPLTSHLVQSLRSNGAVPPHHLYAFMARTETTSTLPWFLATFRWIMPNNQHITCESLSFHHFHLVTKGPLRAGRSGDRITMMVRFSAAVQTGPRAHPASCTMGTGSFPGVKRLWRGVERPPLSWAGVKERLEQYLYSPSGPSRPVAGWTVLLTFTLQKKTMMYNC